MLRPGPLPWCACMLAVLGAAPEAQDEDRHGLLGRLADETPAESVLERDLLTGDWFGLRPWLAERGGALSLTVVADSSLPFSGALRRRRTDRALFDLGLEWDLEQAAGLPGSSLFVEAYSESGRDGSVDVGDAQAYSNIDGPNVAQLAELWVEHVTESGGLRVKAGKVDVNSEFAFAEAGLPFVHSSAGYSPTVFLLPTYPDPTVGLALFARPAEGWQLGLGVYNARDGALVSGRRGLTAHFDEAFLVGELERSWGEAGAGRVAVGGWRHTGDHARFDGGTESGTGGVYAVVEQRLTRERPELEGDRQGLVAFAQLGFADDAVSPFEAHVGAGAVYTGLLPGYDSWRTGVYASLADLADDPAAGLGGEELALELFQEILLAPSIVLKPDLQLVVDPSGRKDTDDVWIATLRLEMFL